MVNIVGFLQGVRESNDYWTKKAEEARDEYNRYVQSNPDSTVDERIERQKLLGGGMDYLTRLMPEKSNVTKNVGVQTQFRQDQQDQRNRAAAQAKYAERRDLEAQARYNEWIGNTDARKELLSSQLSSARNAAQQSQFRSDNMEDEYSRTVAQQNRQARSSELSIQNAGLALQENTRNNFFKKYYGAEKPPKYSDYLAYMNKADTQNSFGSLLTPEMYQVELDNFHEKLEIDENIRNQQLQSLEIENAKAYESQIVNLLNAGVDVNANDSNDAIINVLSDKSEEFKKLGPIAQSAVVDDARRTHNDKVRQNITTALNDWATGFNADPAKWDGPEGLGSQFETKKLSPENRNFVASQVKILSNNRRTAEADNAKRQLVSQVLEASNEDQIASAKKAIEAQFPLLPPEKMAEVMSAIIEIEQNKSAEFKQNRSQAVNNLNASFVQAIKENKFPNLPDMQAALASELESVSHLNIASQELTKLENILADEFETNLTREATQANEAEKTNALSAVAEDNATTAASFQTPEQVVESIKNLGAIVSSSLSLSDSDKIILGTNLTKAYGKMENLARELGIPLNAEFVNETLKDVSRGNHTDSLSIVSPTGVLQSTLLDAMQENLYLTYDTSPSMRAYMSSLYMYNPGPDKLGVTLSTLTDPQRQRIGQLWTGSGGGKERYYEEKYDVIPDGQFGAVGHPKHGGKRDSGLVITVEQIEKDAAVDVNLTTQNVSEVLPIVTNIQAEAKAWTDLYSGQNAKQPFSNFDKTEFSNSRAGITHKTKRWAATVKDALIETVEAKERISTQIQQGNFYQSQISNSNLGTQEKMLGHIQTLDQSIQQYQRLLSTLQNVNQTLSKTEMDLEPRGANEIRNKYVDLSGDYYIPNDPIIEFESKTFSDLEKKFSSQIDELLARGVTNTRDLLSGIESQNARLLQAGQAGTYGNRQTVLPDSSIVVLSPDQFDVVYRDALAVAFMRPDVMTMQAEEFQMVDP